MIRVDLKVKRQQLFENGVRSIYIARTQSERLMHC
jgi:hypothetical protein